MPLGANTTTMPPRPLTILLTFGLILGGSLGLAAPAQGQAPVTVQLGEASVAPGDTVAVPIYVGNLVNAGPVHAYQFDVAFDTTAVTFIGIGTKGTLSEAANFRVAHNPDIPRIGAFSGTTLATAGDEGVLLRIRLRMKTTGTPTVSLTQLQFNEGVPPATPARPSVTLRSSH